MDLKSYNMDMFNNQKLQKGLELPKNFKVKANLNSKSNHITECSSEDNQELFKPTFDFEVYRKDNFETELQNKIKSLIDGLKVKYPKSFEINDGKTNANFYNSFKYSLTFDKDLPANQISISDKSA